MSKTPSIVTDTIRLATLDDYCILNTPAEPGFDDAVALARQICGAPVALVSIVAADRQWFKATSGTALTETPIEQSVCAHAIAQSETLVIPDLTQDERTRDNCLVTEPPFFRFYAGALLKTAEGVPLGTLCVLDMQTHPQGLTQQQIVGLEALARQVMLLLDLQRALEKSDAVVGRQKQDASTFEKRQAYSERLINLLTEGERRLRMAQEVGRVGSFEVDIRTNLLTPSEQFCRIYGLPYRSTMDPSEVEDLVLPVDQKIVSHRQEREPGDLQTEVEYRVRRPADGSVAWIIRRAELVADTSGRPVRMLGPSAT